MHSKADFSKVICCLGGFLRAARDDAKQTAQPHCGARASLASSLASTSSAAGSTIPWSSLATSPPALAMLELRGRASSGTRLLVRARPRRLGLPTLWGGLDPPDVGGLWAMETRPLPSRGGTVFAFGGAPGASLPECCGSQEAPAGVCESARRSRGLEGNGRAAAP